MAADDFEMLVSCARRLSDFFGYFIQFLSASTHFLQGFLSLSDPVDLNFLKSS
jgi:hypothetical protein